MPGHVFNFPDPDHLDRVMMEEMEGLGDDAELAFAAHARRRSGRMARNVKAHRQGQSVMVTVFARNPLSGYDYVGVTRFGHKVEFIVPRFRTVRPATVLATGRRRAQGRRAALRFVIGGRVIYARRVKGFKPVRDWADDAMPEVNAAATRAMARIGRRIQLQR